MLDGHLRQSLETSNSAQATETEITWFPPGRLHYVRGLAPALLHYDPERFAMALELLAEHIILRHGLIAGQRQEALLHGDLHTGSAMVTATDTRVIDAEFAAYGPIGFDLGLFIGNLLMAYFSQPGHESSRGERFEHGEWILGQIGEFWREFVARFDALWSAPRVGDGS